MKILLIATAYLMLTSTLFAQKINYRDIKYDVCPPVCGWYPYETLLEIEPQIAAVDTNTLTAKSVYGYLDDAGMIYYQLYAYKLDSTHIARSAYYYSRAAAFEPKIPSPCWNAALAYSLACDCENMDVYLTRYMLLEKKKNLNEAKRKNIEFIRQKCN